MAVAVGKIGHQPFAEEVAHFERKPQQHVAGLPHADGGGGIEDALDLGVVERGDHRGHHDRGRHARRGQLPQRLEPARRRRRSRLHHAGEPGIERRHRQRHLDQIALRHAREDLEVAQHQRGFRHDADRMAVAVKHFEDAPHHLMLPLDRLVRIGVGADGDGARHVAGGGQLAFEQLGRVRLGEQLGFEIEPRRQAEIGVGRAREAIDAAVLAAAIGVDRAVEGNVGGVVPGDDLTGGVDGHRGLERRQLLETLPAIIEGDASERLVAAGGVRLRPPAAAAIAFDRDLARRIEVDGGGTRLRGLHPRG